MPGPASRSVILIRASALLAGIAIATSLAAGALAADTPEPSAAAPMVSELGLQVAPAPVRERGGWHPPREILVAPTLHGALPRLQQVAPEVRFIEVSDSTPAGELAGADAAIGICDEKILQAAPHIQGGSW